MPPHLQCNSAHSLTPLVNFLPVMRRRQLAYIAPAQADRPGLGRSFSFRRVKASAPTPAFDRLLSPERAALGESGLATSGLAEDLRAAGADDDGLCVREDGGDGEAAWALNIHEEGPRAWDEGLDVVLML